MACKCISRIHLAFFHSPASVKRREFCRVQAALPCTSVAILAESASSPLDKASGKVAPPEPMLAIDEKQTSASSKPGGHKDKGAKKRHGRLRQIAG